MTKGLRFTEEAWRQIAARNTRWQRGTMLPLVGEANAQDAIRDMPCESCGRDLSDGHIHAAAIPTLTDAVAGPGLTKRPYKRRKASAVPYFQQLTALLRPLGVPDPIPEFRFDAKRKWRFDFAWPAPVKLALEIDGGIWINGGHNRGKALLDQYEKQNAAVLQGWRILRYSPEQLAEAARDVAKVFGR